MTETYLDERGAFDEFYEQEAAALEADMARREELNTLQELHQGYEDLYGIHAQ